MWNDDYGEGVGVLDAIMLFSVARASGRFTATGSTKSWQQASLIDARAARLRKGKVPAADAIVQLRLASRSRILGW
jgi:hypothetical protein